MMTTFRDSLRATLAEAIDELSVARHHIGEGDFSQAADCLQNAAGTIDQVHTTCSCEAAEEPA